jgi:hypothetical protein
MSVAYACVSQVHCSGHARPWARDRKPISISALVQRKHIAACPRQLRVWSAASLQTLTVDEPYEVEVSYLSAQIEVLSSVRSLVIGLDEQQQARSWLATLASTPQILLVMICV